IEPGDLAPARRQPNRRGRLQPNPCEHIGLGTNRPNLRQPPTIEETSERMGLTESNLMEDLDSRAGTIQVRFGPLPNMGRLRPRKRDTPDVRNYRSSDRPNLLFGSGARHHLDHLGCPRTAQVVLTVEVLRVIGLTEADA